MTTKEMTTQEIFQKCPEINRFGHDWKKAYSLVSSMIRNSDKARMMRSGNSLFLIMITGKHQAEVSMFNADPPIKFARNFKEFAEAMRLAGYTSVTGVTDNLPTLQLIERFGYPIKIENLGPNGKGITQYRGTVNV
jgi:hypothetical protein